MPYGVECDQYSVLGEILDMDTVENKLTKEEIYVLTLDVNELQFDICVPVKSVTGSPKLQKISGQTFGVRLYKFLTSQNSEFVLE